MRDDGGFKFLLGVIERAIKSAKELDNAMNKLKEITKQGGRMDYTAIIEDLNADIYDEFGVEPIESGFEYTYSTTGGMDRILFAGVEIYNSENYCIEGNKDVDEMRVAEFEDYLEKRVKNIGDSFLKYSFNTPKCDDLRKSEIESAEKAMNSLGIQVKDGYGQFRPLNEVMIELGQTLKTLRENLPNKQFELVRKSVYGSLVGARYTAQFVC